MEYFLFFFFFLLLVVVWTEKKKYCREKNVHAENEKMVVCITAHDRSGRCQLNKKQMCFNYRLWLCARVECADGNQNWRA